MDSISPSLNAVFNQEQLLFLFKLLFLQKVRELFNVRFLYRKTATATAQKKPFDFSEDL